MRTQADTAAMIRSMMEGEDVQVETDGDRPLPDNLETAPEADEGASTTGDNASAPNVVDDIAEEHAENQDTAKDVADVIEAEAMFLDAREAVMDISSNPALSMTPGLLDLSQRFGLLSGTMIQSFSSEDLGAHEVMDLSFEELESSTMDKIIEWFARLPKRIGIVLRELKEFGHWVVEQLALQARFELGVVTGGARVLSYKDAMAYVQGVDRIGQAISKLGGLLTANAVRDDESMQKTLDQAAQIVNASKWPAGGSVATSTNARLTIAPLQGFNDFRNLTRDIPRKPLADLGWNKARMGEFAESTRKAIFRVEDALSVVLKDVGKFRSMSDSATPRLVRRVAGNVSLAAINLAESCKLVVRQIVTIQKVIYHHPLNAVQRYKANNQ